MIGTILVVWSFGALLAGITSRRTTVPFGPRISLTTSSRRQPTTSTISLLPWATPMILSAGATCLVLSAGPAGTRRTTFTWSLSLCNTAPMPSRDRLMLMSKFSALSGDR
ncbi:hypothetical protein D9M71_557260 [compost metagenome]